MTTQLVEILIPDGTSRGILLLKHQDSHWDTWRVWTCASAHTRVSIHAFIRIALQAAALLEGGQERIQEFVESLEYEPAAYVAAKQRLQAINGLLQDCGCATTAELLAVADDSRAALARWADVSGSRPLDLQRGRLHHTLSLPSCKGSVSPLSRPA